MQKLLFILLLFPIAGNTQPTFETTKKKAAAVFEKDQVKPQVLLLGVFHFAGEKVDANTTPSALRINVMDEKRQQEIAALIKQIAIFKPTRIAVEAPPQYQHRYDSVYGLYRSGSPITGQSPSAEDEIVQLGFRLAKQLGHERVYAVDADPFRFRLSASDSVTTFEKYKDMGDSSYGYWEPRYDAEKRLSDSLGAFGTLTDYLLYLNDPAKLAKANGRWLVTTKRGSAIEPIGADGFITRYFNRNVRIYSNIQKIVTSKEDRILVIYGATHMYLLKTLFEASPEFEFKDLRDYISTQHPARTATQVLQQMQQKLESFSTVSYTHTRETRYFADNYQNKMKADLLMDFTGKGPVGLRFRGEDDKSLFIYNGSMILRISKENMTIDSVRALTYQSIQSNSYLYHSLAMLRRMIPIILNNDTIVKTLSDTVIGNKIYDNIHIEGDGMYFQLLGGIERHTVADLKRPYQLLIDRETGLPFQFIAKYIRGTDDRDYVTVTYSNIETKPVMPVETSWNYAAYAGTYSPYVAPVKIPVIKPGAIAPGFTLAAYTPVGADSIRLSSYGGKIVLLDFWFKSCSPCMAAMPHYNELQNSFDKKDFSLLTVNVEDPVEDIAFFYKKHKPVYPMLYGGNELWKSLGFTGCPSAILIGRDGKVVEAFYGFNKDTLTGKIGALINP